LTLPGSGITANEDLHEKTAAADLTDSEHHRSVEQTNLCEHKVRETSDDGDVGDVGDGSDAVVIAPRVPSRWQVSCTSRTDDTPWLLTDRFATHLAAFLPACVLGFIWVAQFEGADHVANEEMKNSSTDPSERLLLAMLEKDTASLEQLVPKDTSP